MPPRVLRIIELKTLGLGKALTTPAWLPRHTTPQFSVGIHSKKISWGFFVSVDSTGLRILDRPIL